MVLSTINRTLKSYALAIVAAEYVLGWLPRGTHQWDRFVTPDELEAHVSAAGLRPGALHGLHVQSARAMSGASTRIRASTISRPPRSQPPRRQPMAKPKPKSKTKATAKPKLAAKRKPKSKAKPIPRACTR